MSKKVLIIEDNTLNMRLFTDVLNTVGLDIVQVLDGHKAVEEVERHNPDLILMDIHVADVSGLDLTREIRKNPKFEKTPIIAVTAFTATDDQKAIYASGCTGYISKPISIVHFLQSVKDGLNVTIKEEQ